MRTMLSFIVGSMIATGLILFFLWYKFGFTRENIISIIGYYSIFSSAVIIYLQLKVNLSYNKRKAAMDFSYDKVGKELSLLLKGLKVTLGKDYAVFTKEQTFKDFLSTDPMDAIEKKKLRESVLDILNFYERMSIGVLKEAYDEDICYDDSGFNLLQFYGWTKGFINELKDKHDPRIFINFQHLAEHWAKRLELETKKQKDVLYDYYKKGRIPNPRI